MRTTSEQRQIDLAQLKKDTYKLIDKLETLRLLANEKMPTPPPSSLSAEELNLLNRPFTLPKEMMSSLKKSGEKMQGTPKSIQIIEGFLITIEKIAGDPVTNRPSIQHPVDRKSMLPGFRTNNLTHWFAEIELLTTKLNEQPQELAPRRRQDEIAVVDDDDLIDLDYHADRDDEIEIDALHQAPPSKHSSSSRSDEDEDLEDHVVTRGINAGGKGCDPEPLEPNDQNKDNLRRRLLEGQDEEQAEPQKFWHKIIAALIIIPPLLNGSATTSTAAGTLSGAIVGAALGTALSVTLIATNLFAPGLALVAGVIIAAGSTILGFTSGNMIGTGMGSILSSVFAMHYFSDPSPIKETMHTQHKASNLFRTPFSKVGAKETTKILGRKLGDPTIHPEHLHPKASELERALNPTRMLSDLFIMHSAFACVPLAAITVVMAPPTMTAAAAATIFTIGGVIQAGTFTIGATIQGGAINLRAAATISTATYARYGIRNWIADYSRALATRANHNLMSRGEGLSRAQKARNLVFGQTSRVLSNDNVDFIRHWPEGLVVIPDKLQKPLGLASAATVPLISSLRDTAVFASAPFGFAHKTISMFKKPQQRAAEEEGLINNGNGANAAQQVERGPANIAQPSIKTIAGSFAASAAVAPFNAEAVALTGPHIGNTIAAFTATCATGVATFDTVNGMGSVITAATAGTGLITSTIGAGVFGAAGAIANTTGAVLTTLATGGAAATLAAPIAAPLTPKAVSKTIRKIGDKLNVSIPNKNQADYKEQYRLIARTTFAGARFFRAIEKKADSPGERIGRKIGVISNSDAEPAPRDMGRAIGGMDLNDFDDGTPNP